MHVYIGTVLPKKLKSAEDSERLAVNDLRQLIADSNGL